MSERTLADHHVTHHSSGTVAARAVLITGASGGIGGALCQTFAEAGWWVGVHYRQNKLSAEVVLQKVRKAGPGGDLYEADVRRAESVERMIADFSSRTSGPLALICNAGIAASRLLLREREEAWTDLVATNLTGTFYCLRALAPILFARGGGSIVVLGSHAGCHGMIGQAAYAASKAGLIGLVKTAAQEWGPENIRVNLVLPGWHQTGLSEGAMPSDQGWTDHALKRPPSLDETARTVLHLAELNDVSGQVWNCDSRNL
jgi:3-oxoacyl-[acyl-carrier protein] reductase